MDEKLKVIHVIGGGEFGGAEQHIIQLLSLMPQHNVKGKVICFYEAGLSRALREKGVEVEVLHYGRFDLRLISGLRRVFKKDKPDIIHTHGVKANFFARLAGRSLKGIRLVTTIHSLLKFDYINRMAYLLASLMERSTRSINDHFIAVSHAIEASLKEEKVNREHITVVHHGIDFGKYSQGTGRLREELGLSDESFIVGVVTRLVKIKGMEFMIGAMPRILENNPLALLVIVGEGPQVEELKQLAARLGLEDKIYFAGFHDDVTNCLKCFDVFVSASLSEGLGLNVLEAMAASVPVVSTRVGGILDFMTDRTNGLLVTPRSSDSLADAIIEINSDPELARRLAQEARLLVEQKFSPNKMLQETLQVYEKLLEGQHD